MNIIYAWMWLLFCESAAGKSSIIQLRTNKHYTAFNEINKFFSAIQHQLDVVQTSELVKHPRTWRMQKKKFKRCNISFVFILFVPHYWYYFAVAGAQYSFRFCYLRVDNMQQAQKSSKRKTEEERNKKKKTLKKTHMYGIQTSNTHMTMRRKAKHELEDRQR